MDTWLIYKLTGGAEGGAYVTDVSNAARTNLMDIRSRKWHPETCRTFGLQADMLAEIRSNAEVYGHVKEGPFKGETRTVSILALLTMYCCQPPLAGITSILLVTLNRHGEVIQSRPCVLTYPQAAYRHECRPAVHTAVAHSNNF